jgi:hypothetical protein
MCYKEENKIFQNKLFEKLINEINKISLMYPNEEIDIDIDTDYIDPYGYDECNEFFYILLKKSIMIYVKKNNPDEIKYRYYQDHSHQPGQECEFNSYKEAIHHVSFYNSNNNFIKSNFIKSNFIKSNFIKSKL